jgi:transmembrane sensor
MARALQDSVLHRTALAARHHTMKTSANNRDAARQMLLQQAWQWLRLLHSGVAKAEDAQGFRQWVRASEAHQSAYQEAKRRWDSLHNPAGALLQNQADFVTVYERKLHGRRAFLGGIATTAAVALFAVNYSPWGLWPTSTELRADYRTGTGEQRSIELNEHIHLTLNTRSSASPQIKEGGVIGLELFSGEAAIELAALSTPFFVRAGAGSVSAESGQFEVRHLAQQVCVSCIAGGVHLSHPMGSRTLQANEQVMYDAASVTSVSSVDPQALSSWRRGLLVFKRTPLGDALDEINRYRPGRVVLVNAAAREKNVTGNFAIASLDLALVQLQHVFGLKARSLPGGLLVLS